MKISCGHCNMYLGTLTELMESTKLDHICLETDNVTLDIENGKIWRTIQESTQQQQVEYLIHSPKPSGNSFCAQNQIANKTILQTKLKDQSPSFQQILLETPNKESVWTDEGVKLLINVYREQKEKFLSPMYNKRNVWELISRELAKHDILKSPMKCDEKWRNLKKTYDKVLKEKHSTGNSNSHWRYFEDMHEIYSQDPHFNPKFTISSTGQTCKKTVPADEDDSENTPKKSKKSTVTATEIEERRQKRHEEKMKQRQEIFEWFKENFKKD